MHCTPARIRQVGARLRDYGASNTGSLTLHLLILLDGPALSGSTSTSRLCRGRLPPSPTFPGSGCPQLHQATATTQQRWSLTTPRHTQRLVAHSSPTKKTAASRTILLASSSSRISVRRRLFSSRTSEGGAISLTGVDVGLADPAASGFLTYPELPADLHTGRSQIRVLTTVVEDQANRALFRFFRNASRHKSILSQTHKTTTTNRRGFTPPRHRSGLPQHRPLHHPRTTGHRRIQNQTTLTFTMSP